MSKIYHNIGAPEGHLTYVHDGKYKCSCQLQFKSRDALSSHVRLMKMLKREDCKHEWSCDEQGNRRCIGCGMLKP